MVVRWKWASPCVFDVCDTHCSLFLVGFKCACFFFVENCYHFNHPFVIIKTSWTIATYNQGLTWNKSIYETVNDTWLNEPFRSEMIDWLSVGFVGCLELGYLIECLVWTIWDMVSFIEGYTSRVNTTKEKWMPFIEAILWFLSRQTVTK